MDKETRADQLLKIMEALNYYTVLTGKDTDQEFRYIAEMLEEELQLNIAN
ncbi:hypothetical protein [Geomicrobium sediminis]|uniref:Fur-regulated basic protein FbpA n=1 Tax=Geomicrobium sediminis TaxID=1347788 RepID=A0ABS2PH20_9BACL|nr:hypothetical protein [Geomicrobium sediminis]MBM7634577.1 hypothetical protein [Geomicrobium sediminis]